MFFFNIGVDRDAKNPNIDIALFSQGGISLPDISLFKDKDIAEKYMDHMVEIFGLFGFLDPISMADEAYEFEEALSKIMLPNDQLIDPFALYNKINMTGLRQMSDLSWDSFLLGLNYPELEQVSVDVVSFF